MTAPDLDHVEKRLREILDRYRPELVDATIYGIPSLVWPGSGGHDYFAAIRRGAKAVSLYLVIADRYPEDLAAASPALQAARTGRATFAFRTVDDTMASELSALLDRLLDRYRHEHTAAKA